MEREILSILLVPIYYIIYGRMDPSTYSALEFNRNRVI